jgi:hypothetical protein
MYGAYGHTGHHQDRSVYGGQYAQNQASEGMLLFCDSRSLGLTAVRTFNISTPCRAKLQYRVHDYCSSVRPIAH